MLSTFLRDREQVYRTYSTTSPGVDRLLFVNNVLYVTVFGRQEDWEGLTGRLAATSDVRLTAPDSRTGGPNLRRWRPPQVRARWWPARRPRRPRREVRD